MCKTEQASGRRSRRAICKCQHSSRKITQLLFLCFVTEVIAIRGTKGSDLRLQVAEGKSERKGKGERERNGLERREKQHEDEEKRGDEGGRGNRNIVLEGRWEERDANIRKAGESDVAVLIEERTAAEGEASDEAERDAQLSASVGIWEDSALRSSGACAS